MRLLVKNGPWGIRKHRKMDIRVMGSPCALRCRKFPKPKDNRGAMVGSSLLSALLRVVSPSPRTSPVISATALVATINVRLDRYVMCFLIVAHIRVSSVIDWQHLP